MTEEEKKAIEWLKNADFFSARIYAPSILNLIEKQQERIEFYSKQELSYIAGYQDGKNHKQTAISIKAENEQQELFQREIAKYKDEIEALKKGNKSLMDSRKKWKDRYYKQRKEMENNNESKPKFFIHVNKDGSTELIDPELALKLTQITIQSNEKPGYVWDCYEKFKEWIAEEWK